MSPFHAITERLGRYKWMGPDKQDVQHARDGTYSSVMIRDSSSWDGATIDRKNSAMQTDSLNH